MPVDACAAAMWLGLALAAESTKAAADAELIEFLGSFETKTGQWPELAELLATRRPAAPAPVPPASQPKEPKR
jgi:hypothetical protein